MPTHISPATVTHPRNLGIVAPAGPPPQLVSVVGFQGSPGTVSPDPVEVVSVALTVRRFGDYTLPCSVKWRGVAPATGSALPKEYFAANAYPGGTASFAAGQGVAPIAFSLRAGDPPPSACAFQLQLYEPGGCAIDEMAGAVTIVMPGREAQAGDSTVALSVPFDSLTRVGTAPTPHTVAVTRTGDLSGTANVSILVEGALASQVPASVFQDGVYPSGLLSFAVGEAARPFTFTVTAGELPSVEQNARIRLLNPLNCVLAAGTDQAVVRLPAAPEVTEPGGGGTTPVPSGGIVAYSDPLTTKADGSPLIVVEVSSAAALLAEAANRRSHSHRIEYTQDIGGFTIPASDGGSSRFPLIISAKGATGANLAAAHAITGDVHCRAPFVWFWKTRQTGCFFVEATDIWCTRVRRQGLKFLYLPHAASHQCRRFVEAFFDHLMTGTATGDHRGVGIEMWTAPANSDLCMEEYLFAHGDAKTVGYSKSGSLSDQYVYAEPGGGQDKQNFNTSDPALCHRKARWLYIRVKVACRDGFYWKHCPAEMGWCDVDAENRSVATRGNNPADMWAHDCNFRAGVDVQGMGHVYDRCYVGVIELHAHMQGDLKPQYTALRSQIGGSEFKLRGCRGSKMILGTARTGNNYYKFGKSIHHIQIEDWNGSVVDAEGNGAPGGRTVPFSSAGIAEGSGAWYDKPTTVKKAASTVGTYQSLTLGDDKVGPALPGRVRPRPATETQLQPWPGYEGRDPIDGGPGTPTPGPTTDPYALVAANWVGHLPVEQTGVSVTWLSGGGVELRSGVNEAANKNMRIWCRTAMPTGRRLYAARFTVLDSITVANDGEGIFALWVFQFLGTATGVPADVSAWAPNLYRGGDLNDCADEYYRYRGQGYRNSFANMAPSGGAVSQTTRCRTYNGSSSNPDTAIAGVPDNATGDFAMASGVEYEIRGLLDPGSATVAGTLEMTKTRLSDGQTHRKTFTSALLRTLGSGGRMGLAAQRGRAMRVKPVPGVPLVAAAP